MMQMTNYMALVAKEIREHGWVSGSAAYQAYQNGYSQMSTAKVAKMNYEDGEEATAADYITAAKAVAYGKSLEPTGGADYESRVAEVARMDKVGKADMGVAASMIVAMQNAKNREMDEGSEHFGEVGKRAEYIVRVASQKSFESRYGTKYLFKMYTPEGNLAVWFTTTNHLEAGKTYRVKATVKQHDYFNGVEQTVLTRIQVISEVGAAKVVRKPESKAPAPKPVPKETPAPEIIAVAGQVEQTIDF